MAWFTALSRVSNYKHHWSDVLAGATLGTVVAVVMVSIIHLNYPTVQIINFIRSWIWNNATTTNTRNFIRPSLLEQPLHGIYKCLKNKNFFLSRRSILAKVIEVSIQGLQHSMLCTRNKYLPSNRIIYVKLEPVKISKIPRLTLNKNSPITHIVLCLSIIFTVTKNIPRVNINYARSLLFYILNNRSSTSMPIDCNSKTCMTAAISTFRNAYFRRRTAWRTCSRGEDVAQWMRSIVQPITKPGAVHRWIMALPIATVDLTS